MAQEDIIQLIKKNKGVRFTSTQLMKQFNLAEGSINTNLKSIRKFKLLNFELCPNEGRRSIYQYWAEG